MGQQYPAKSFKSGNSVAIRMPAALGIEPDREWKVVMDDDRIVIEPVVKPKRKFNIAKVAGSASSLRYIEPDSRLFEPRPSSTDKTDPR